MNESEKFLDGQLLIAMPTISDPRFHRSVIFMCAHSGDGAMGIIINQKADNIDFRELLEQLDILPERQERGHLDGGDNFNVHVGGPVETGRGFVLHSSDYFVDESTLPISEVISLTATVDILRSIATGSGPENSLLALGYAGWGPGQLEAELLTNGWLNCPVDFDLIFKCDVDTKYEQALATLGVDPSHLVSHWGSA